MARRHSAIVPAHDERHPVPAEPEAGAQHRESAPGGSARDAFESSVSARLSRAAAVLCVTLLAVWARMSAAPQVFVHGHVLPRFGDAHYHLLRIAQTVADFPRVPAFDPNLNWPDGAALPWAPGFDALGAGFVLLLTGGGGPHRVEYAAALFPVVLGVLVVWVTMALAGFLARGSRSALPVALATGLVAAVQPRMVHTAQVGRVDHHVFEALCMLGLGLWALAAAAATRRDDAGWRFALGFEATGAALVFLVGSGFNGSILYVTIAGAMLASVRLTTPGRVPLVAGSGAPACLVGAIGLLALAIKPLGLHGQLLSYVLPSLLQPLLHALGGLCLLAVGLATRAGVGCRGSLRRVALRGAALAGLLGVLAVLAWPFAGEAVGTGFTDWLGRGDPWLASVDEFRSFFAQQPDRSPGILGALYDHGGIVGVLAPFTLAFAVARTARREGPVAVALGVWTLALVALNLLQVRFGRILAPLECVALALAMGDGVDALARRIGPRARASGLARWLSLPLVAALLAADPGVREMLVPLPSRELSALESVALYLHDQPDPRPDAPGVLASWEKGHTLLQLSQRPVLTAGFGTQIGHRSFEEAQHFMALDPEGLEELMERRRASWLVTGMEAAFPSAADRGPDRSKPFFWNSERGRVEWSVPYLAEHPLAPILLGGGGDPHLGVPHVATLMPRFASPYGARGLGFPMPRQWLYERVPGARLVGDAEPGALVEAIVPFAVRGDPASYVAWTLGRADGHFELVLPLPNGVDQGGIATGRQTRLRVAGRDIARVSISERDVRSGAIRRIARSGVQRSASATP